MKQPLWEVSPGALEALLETNVFAYCDLHTFVLSGGAGTIRIAAADTDITYPAGPTWSSRGPRIDPDEGRQTGHWKRGLDVDTWQTIIMPRVFDEITGATFPDQINGSPWGAAARQGALDGADYQVDRAYFAAWPVPYVPVFTPVGIITLFAGLASEVDVNDSVVAITSNDYRCLLGSKEPHKVFQSGCGHTLFDAGCSLDPDDFKVPLSALVGSTRTKLKSSPTPPPGSGTYALGRVVMTSGLNSSFSRTVTAYNPANGDLSLLNPLPFDVAPGDTFDAYSGCDKKFATCQLFANTANFGGQPFIPQAETAI